MLSFIEPLYKSRDEIKFAWNQEEGAVSYKIYVGVVSDPLSLIYTNIPKQVSTQAIARGKVMFKAQIDDVQGILSLPITSTFLNSVLFWTITYVDSLGAESPIADSTVVEVPPVGITGKLMKDDPTIRQHPFVFSDELQRWTKIIGSSSGAQIVDTSDLYKANITTEYTYDGSNNVLTATSYLSDATTGSAAKLTTYTYSGSDVVKIQITDTTASI